jgi:hypothetical protein
MIVPRIALAAAALFPVVLPAQSTASSEAPHHVVVGSSDEDYLRYLQIAGLVSVYPWSIREFSQPELARLTTSVTMVREFNGDLLADAWDMNLLVGFRLGLPRRLK